MTLPPEYQCGFCFSVPKYKANHTLSPWLSARPDSKEKRFIQIGDSLMFSEQFQKLSYGAKMLYFAMAMEAAGKIEFQFPQTVATKHGFPQKSFRRYVSELKDGGFITVNSGWNTREANIYKFALSWKAPPQISV